MLHGDRNFKFKCLLLLNVYGLTGGNQTFGGLLLLAHCKEKPVVSRSKFSSCISALNLVFRSGYDTVAPQGDMPFPPARINMLGQL